MILHTARDIFDILYNSFAPILYTEIGKLQKLFKLKEPKKELTYCKFTSYYK